VKSDSLRCDETSATGESDAISKASLEEISKKASSVGDSTSQTSSDCFLLSGSKVIEGHGSALVIAVGQDSFQGRIFMDLRSSQPSTTRMQKQLGDLAERIARIASAAGALLFLALMIRFFVELKTKPDRSSAKKGQAFIQLFVISVTLVVVA